MCGPVLELYLELPRGGDTEEEYQLGEEKRKDLNACTHLGNRERNLIPRNREWK